MLEKIEALADNNPNGYWKLVNSIKTSQKSKDHNEISSSEWFEYFKNLNKNEHLCTEESSTEAKIVKDYNKWAAQKIDVLDRPISTEELYKISKKLKNKKACANDPLSNEIIKLSVGILPSYFVNSFNLILSQGVFPSAWSKGCHYINQVIPMTPITSEEFVRAVV
jgi:hypothetical protein